MNNVRERKKERKKTMNKPEERKKKETEPINLKKDIN